MVKSDGNGSYIIDKNLWKGMIALVCILLAITGAFGTSILATINDLSVNIHENDVADAGQGADIRAITKQLERIETKLDALIKPK